MPTNSTSNGKPEPLLVKSHQLRKQEKAQMLREKAELRDQRGANTSDGSGTHSAIKLHRKTERALLRQSLEACTRDQLLVCLECDQKFDSKRKRVAYEAHISKCRRKQSSSVKDMIHDKIGVLKKVHEHKAHASIEATRTIIFESHAQFKAEVSCTSDGSSDLVVNGIKWQTSRLKTCVYLVPGCHLRSINDEPCQAIKAAHEVDGIFSIMRHISIQSFPCAFTFTLPQPSMLKRGWARMLTRAARIQFSEEQEAFMLAQWELNNKITAASLRERMDVHFVGREELQLLDSEVQLFLSRIYSRVRRTGQAGVDAARDQNQEGGEDADINSVAALPFVACGRGMGRGGAASSAAAPQPVARGRGKGRGEAASSSTAVPPRAAARGRGKGRGGAASSAASQPPVARGRGRG